MILESLLLPTLGKKQFQWLYTRLYKVSLLGMNVSGGGDFRMSGELHVCRYIDVAILNRNCKRVSFPTFGG